MGAVAALATVGGSMPWSPTTRHAVMTGLLGGFTTFSAFSMQTVALAIEGQWTAAALNVLLSVAVCIGGCWAGYAGEHPFSPADNAGRAHGRVSSASRC